MTDTLQHRCRVFVLEGIFNILKGIFEATQLDKYGRPIRIRHASRLSFRFGKHQSQIVIMEGNLKIFLSVQVITVISQ